MYISISGKVVECHGSFLTQTSVVRVGHLVKFYLLFSDHIFLPFCVTFLRIVKKSLGSPWNSGQPILAVVAASAV